MSKARGTGGEGNDRVRKSSKTVGPEATVGSSDVIGIIDSQGRILSINPGAESILGYDPADLVGRTLNALIPGDHQLLYQSALERFASSNGRPTPWTAVRFPVLDSTNRVIDAEVSFGSFPSEIPHGFIGVMRNASCPSTTDADCYGDLFRSAPVGLHSLDSEGRYVEMNDSEARILGRARGEIVSKPFEENLVSDYRPVFRRHFESLEAGLSVADMEYEIQRPDGSIRRVIVSDSPVLRDGRLRATRGSMIDVTEARERKREHDELDRRYRMLFDRNLAGIFRARVDDGRVFECNDAFARLLGYDSRLELIRSGGDLYVDSRDRESAFEALRRTGLATKIELALRKKDGTPIWTVQNLSLLETPATEARVIEGTAFDITDRRLAEEKSEYQAFHDTLTGLPSASLFERHVTEAISRAGAKGFVTVLLVGLDDFKVINDTLGHSVGNELLQLVAFRIQKALRNDDIVSRLGGDEFSIAAIVENREGAEAIATKVVQAVSRPYLLKNRTVLISASAGVALSGDNGSDCQALLKAADIAMRTAKDIGKNTFSFSSQLENDKAVDRMKLEADLHRAVDLHQLHLHYQPLIHAASEEIVSVEALVRWNHPERGELLPTEFIPLAERSGLINTIGDWVMSEALEQLHFWISAGIRTRVSVNLSPRQFHDTTLPRRVQGLLGKYGIDASCLELEITENVAMQNPELALENLHEFKKMGVRIALDDFGTGYSSLSYLSRFPVDRIKIDRVFIEEVREQTQGSAIISAVLALARQLGLDVVAEGVETEAQSRFLRAEHCEHLQGFFFARPLPPAEIQPILAARFHHTS